ncbi:MAG: tRNA (adenosine(37)-N6)-threonylcarbamoyltransferase complex dimerization subunit type 1 TsaB [Bdellovibrionaceae bacterium]|nr:tRNA (adenosine(37)-N6)-threonylcarbamoyltransferase complex dimerization subunit type 1 TsaB [Pseudobdellovibrionaceae bacterium]
MLLLSVDTSSSYGSLSIVQVEKNTYHCLSHKQWISNKEQKYSHSEVITVFFQEALKEAKVTLNQLQLIICGVGPGSFTGIRVSANFVKSLSFSLNIPLVAVSSLESLAQKNKSDLAKKQELKTEKNPSKKTALPLTPNQPKEALLPLIHAFSKKIYLAAYTVFDFKSILKKQVVNYNELETLLSLHNIELWHVSGDAYPLFQQYFSNTFKKKLKIYPKITHPCSLTMVELFLQSSEKQKNTLNWKNLLPLYIRSSSAEELLHSKK